MPGTSYHQVTSDEYFGSVVEPDAQFDVIYLDGLHTVEQTLRDLLNALPHLQPQGVLVIDDVRPPTALAAIPDRQEFFEVRSAQGRDDEKAWMGDVFRLVYFIETFCQQLSFRVIANNHGQAVVWRHRRAEVPQRGLAEVGAMTFDDMTQDETRSGWRRSATSSARSAPTSGSAGWTRDRPPVVMGVVNVTPDSFSDGGRYDTVEAAVAHGLALLADGADILDIGGESTRPGATRPLVAEELARVVPVVTELPPPPAPWSASTRCAPRSRRRPSQRVPGSSTTCPAAWPTRTSCGSSPSPASGTSPCTGARTATG